jgi:hypothetical protein
MWCCLIIGCETITLNITNIYTDTDCVSFAQPSRKLLCNLYEFRSQCATKKIIINNIINRRSDRHMINLGSP